MDVDSIMMEYDGNLSMVFEIGVVRFHSVICLLHCVQCHFLCSFIRFALHSTLSLSKKIKFSQTIRCHQYQSGVTATFAFTQIFTPFA